MGAIYHSELRQILHENGYATRDKPGAKNGEFELFGTTEKQIDAFSTGSREVEAKLAEKGLTRETASAAQKEVANLATRKAKKEIKMEAVKKEWGQRAGALDLKKAQKIDPKTLRSSLLTNKQALDSALRHHLQRQSLSRADDIIKTALKNGGTASGIAAEIAKMKASGELVHGKTAQKTVQHDKGRTEIKDGAEVLTTQAAIERDKKMLDMMTSAKCTVTPILNIETAEQTLSTALNAGQRASALGILTTTDQFIAIQGVAGAGKTFALEKIKEALQGTGYEMLGLAPSHQATSELRDVTGTGDTLQRFLVAKKKQSKVGKNTIIVLDESSLASSEQLQKLVEIAARQEARVVFVGDTRQFDGVDAGRPFELMQAHIETHGMETSVRHTDADLAAIAERASRGDITGAAQDLIDKGHVVDIKDDDERYEKMASAYLEKIAGIEKIQDRNKTCRVLTTSNEARREINIHIQEALGLAGNGIFVNTLDTSDATSEELKYIRVYKPGQVLEFQKEFKSLGVAKNDRLTVDEMLADRIRLSNGKDFFPARLDTKKITQYNRQTIELSVGDAIRLRSSCNDWKNGHYATVKSVDGGKIRIEVNGKEHDLSTVDMKIQHGYAATGHSMQGATSSHVIFEANDRNSWYTNLTRAKESSTAFTANLEKFPEIAAREREKFNAIDIQKMPYQNSVAKVHTGR